MLFGEKMIAIDESVRREENLEEFVRCSSLVRVIIERQNTGSKVVLNVLDNHVEHLILVQFRCAILATD